MRSAALNNKRVTALLSVTATNPCLLIKGARRGDR
jgi:hypothetical protein